MTDVQPLGMPMLTRLEAAATRSRHAHRGFLNIGPGLKLRLREPGVHECGPKPVRVALRWGEAALALRCPEELVRNLLQGLEPGLAPVDALPPDLAGLLLEAVGANLLEAWERISGRDAVVVEAARADGPAPTGGLAFELSGATLRCHLHLDCTPAQADAVLLPWPAAPREMDWLALPAVLRLGATRLSRAMLASLRPDDAVLLQHHAPDGAMLVVSEAWAAGTQGAAGCWTLTEKPAPAQAHGQGDWTMVDDRIDTTAAADPDDIPVTLTFEVGRLALPLGELRRLGPGSVLALGRSLGELVEIAAHGRSIGRGELVQIEGVPGVRIVRLFDHG